MNGILVPVNFSETARLALPVAASLASRTGARLVIHHNVTTLSKWSALSPAEKEKYPHVPEQLREATSLLNRLAQEEELKNLMVEKWVTEGITYEQILVHRLIIKRTLFSFEIPLSM